MKKAKKSEAASEYLRYLDDLSYKINQTSL
jgi:hypothetical protein